MHVYIHDRGHHEVATGIADETFDLAFVVPLSGAAVSVPDHVVRQHRAEPLRSLTFAIRHDLCAQATVIVVKHRLRRRAKEREGMDMLVQPSLGVRSSIGTDVTGITMWQIQREEIRLLLDTTNDNQRFTKVSLRPLGSMLCMRLSGNTCPGGWLNGQTSRETLASGPAGNL